MGVARETSRRLLHFPMVRVLAALAAKLAELETLGCSPAVLGRRVILIFAHRALQLTNFARHMPILSISRQRSATEVCPGQSPDIGGRDQDR